MLKSDIVEVDGVFVGAAILQPNGSDRAFYAAHGACPIPSRGSYAEPGGGARSGCRTLPSGRALKKIVKRSGTPRFAGFLR
jgi:hypothetical protein